VGDEHYDVVGLDVLVHCDEDDALAALHDLLGPFARAAPDRHPLIRFDLTVEPSGVRVLERNGEVVARDVSWPRVVGALVVELNRDAIDAFVGFAAHAGCVAAGEDVIAFPGLSGAGKTTLTAACLLAGFDYVSDEALCVRGRGPAVAPYAKPLTLARSACALLERVDLGDAGLSVGGDEEMVTVGQLGASVAGGELNLVHIVELSRRHGPARLLPQPRQRGLASLLSMSFNHYKRPRDAFDVASNLAAGCATWRLEYSDPLAAAALLRAELAA